MVVWLIKKPTDEIRPVKESDRRRACRPARIFNAVCGKSQCCLLLEKIFTMFSLLLLQK